MKNFNESTLKDLGFERYEWEDEDIGKVVDHKFENHNISIEITNYQTVEITTKGQYIGLPNIDTDKKLKQLVKLLSK